MSTTASRAGSGFVDAGAVGVAPVEAAVGGDALAASGLATRHLEALRGDAALGAFDQFTFAGTPARNVTTGRVGVEFFLRLKSKGDEKAKAGRKKG